jgi:hypothetical protein
LSHTLVVLGWEGGARGELTTLCHALEYKEGDEKRGGASGQLIYIAVENFKVDRFYVARRLR